MFLAFGVCFPFWPECFDDLLLLFLVFLRLSDCASFCLRLSFVFRLLLRLLLAEDVAECAGDSIAVP